MIYNRRKIAEKKPFSGYSERTTTGKNSPRFQPFVLVVFALDPLVSNAIPFVIYNKLLALTTRGLMEEDFDLVAEYIHESIKLTQFICDKLEGGSKAPLKVRFQKLFSLQIMHSGIQKLLIQRSRSAATSQDSRR